MQHSLRSHVLCGDDGRSAPRRGFTVIELMVVIAIIALILALGVPAFNTMTRQQRLTKSRALLNGTLTRTHVIALADQNLAAVRIFPAKWYLDEQIAQAGQSGRQMMATYVYRTTYTPDPTNPTMVSFYEQFERLDDGPTQLLPPDTWVAPSEALDASTLVADPFFGSTPMSDYVLSGTIGQFELDADSRTNSGEELLDADDFLIVFDPKKGVRPSIRRVAWPLKAYIPEDTPYTAEGTEAAGDRWVPNIRGYQSPFQRFNFTGVVVYPREPFVALGSEEAEPEDRRDVLRRFGQMYYVDRKGGGLIQGEGGTPGD